MKRLFQLVLSAIIVAGSVQFANAQCAKNRVEMCKVTRCTLQTACVPKGQVQQYINNGWSIGICILSPICGESLNTKPQKKSGKAKS